ncbi:MAG TPA: RNA polymerase sigma factor [Candidatus Binatia bacterium]|nr:RNA polymerase sigma factor [Candidatus Binatia bacterium]
MSRPAASSTELVERHRAEILRYLVRMLGDPDEAQDACQEVFLRAHRAFGRLRADSNPRAWLYRIATNSALNAARQRTRTAARLVDADCDAVAAVAGSPEQREDLRAVVRAVERLPPRQRAALMLRRFDGLGYAAIAATLGGNESAARANVYQAVKRLRAALGGEP